MLYATVQYVPGFDYTVGVDTPSGAPCNVAVTGTPSTIPGAGGGIVDFHLTRVSSFEDFLSQLGISAEASGGFGLFSASAKMDYAMQCKIQSNSLFMLVTVKVTQAAMDIKEPRIVKEADDLLANGQMEEFRHRYGDMFVRGLITDGQFYGLIEIKTRTTEQRESVAVKIEASYGGFFDSSFQYNKTQAQEDGVDSARVLCHIEGGDINAAIPVTAEAMLERARTFPCEITGRAIPYVGLLSSYSILATSKPPISSTCSSRRMCWSSARSEGISSSCCSTTSTSSWSMGTSSKTRARRS
jgi:hypothetical protein